MIVVHGLLGPPTDRLRQAAASADRVVGGRRHLDVLGVPAERRITLGALQSAIDEIAALPPQNSVVVVASGDPLFFGVVRALRSRGLRPAVVTAPSSVAAAFAAVGLPWDDAVIVSVHGRPLASAVNLALASPKVAVLTSAEHGIRELAAGLNAVDQIGGQPLASLPSTPQPARPPELARQLSPGETVDALLNTTQSARPHEPARGRSPLSGVERWFVLAERLGEPDERVRVLNAATAAVTEPVEPNVVLILAAAPDDIDPPWPGGIAGPDRPGGLQVGSSPLFSTLNQVCSSLRSSTPLNRVSVAAAVAFARLLPKPGELLWASGRLGADVAALADWAGAGVVLGPAPVPAPDVVVADAAQASSVQGQPRAVVLTSDARLGQAEEDPVDLTELLDSYHWTSETVDDQRLTTGVRL